MKTLVMFCLMAYLTGAITSIMVHVFIGLLDFALINLTKGETEMVHHSWHLGLRYIVWSFFLWPHFLYSFYKGKTIYHR